MANVVRILTFRVSHCSPEQNERQSQCIGLALNEFPGFVSGQCLTEVSMGIVVGVSVWESRARVSAARGSKRIAEHPPSSSPGDHAAEGTRS